MSQGITAFDALSGISSGFSAFSSIIAADEKAAQQKFRLEQKRKDQELQTEADRLQAEQKQEEINERLDDTLAQRRAIQGASGVDIGSGSARRVREETVESASEAKQRVANNLRLGQLERQSRIGQLAIAEEFRPEITELRGRKRAAQGLSQFALGVAQKKRRKKRRREELGFDQIGDNSSFTATDVTQQTPQSRV